jgi:hypothetical protein
MQTPQPQPQLQPQAASPPLSLKTYIRNIFRRPDELSEFDLCYYETRKVALCAHLLKPK